LHVAKAGNDAAKGSLRHFAQRFVAGMVETPFRVRVTLLFVGPVQGIGGRMARSALACLLVAPLALLAAPADAGREDWLGRAYVHQGVMLARQGDLRDALADFDAALAADPALAPAHIDRGFVLLRLGDAGAALDEADAALRLAPYDALAHNLRGRAEERLGETEAARAEYRQALVLAPGNPAIARNLHRLSLTVPLQDGHAPWSGPGWRSAPSPGIVPPVVSPWQAPPLVNPPQASLPRVAPSPVPTPMTPRPLVPFWTAPQPPVPMSPAPAPPMPPTPSLASPQPPAPAPDAWPTQPPAPMLAQPQLPLPPAYAAPPPQAPRSLREPPPQNLAFNNPALGTPNSGNNPTAGNNPILGNRGARPPADAPSRSGPQSGEPALLDHPQDLPPAPNVALRAGSGVVLDDGTWIVTNRHVIAGARSVAVRNGGGYVRRATIEAVSPTDDLALLRVREAFPATAGVPLAALVPPAAGRQILVMGYPVVDVFGSRRPNLTAGLVARTDGLRDDPTTFQLTAAIRPGNSGSPVFDLQGHLLGIVSELLLQQGHIPPMADEGGAAMSIAIKASRLLALMQPMVHRGAVTVSQSVDAPMLPETLYQRELTSVVLVVAYP
jgi:S1-C subfamily serine protease